MIMIAELIWSLKRLMRKSRKPKVASANAGEEQKQLQGLGMVNCMGFSSNMRLLALGIRDGPVQVLEWPSLSIKANLR